MTSEQNTPTTPFRYAAGLANQIEARWQQRWLADNTFETPNPGVPGFDPARPKFYCLDMFPYPSGAGLHVGHPEGYTATDIICRFKRMKGFNVLHPMGWDAFGLPAEQYAIQTGVHPAETTRAAINNFRRQLQRFGFSYDWAREFGTIDPDYYRWTQWIFLKIYNAWYDADKNSARHIDELIAEFASGARTVRLNPAAAEYTAAGDLAGGTDAGPWETLDRETQRAIIDSYRLAYLAQQTVNWCPKLGTALANEEVIDGRSERGGFPVFRKPLRQWMFRITAYSDRLLEGLDTVDWPQSTRIQQTEWIGRSEGAEIDFPLLAPDGMPTGETLRVFTTRPDTIHGATYMVVAPEHPLVEQTLESPPPGTDDAALRAYAAFARNRSDVERQESKEKTGVFTGVYAENPLTKQRIPVWTADYVLMGYGTGAIMAVPAQDERDFEFATKFDLPIVRTVQPPTDHPSNKAYTGDGPAINSGILDGLHIKEAKQKIIDHLEQHRLGARRVNFRLRDWLFSRQRYWGEPFPIVFDEKGDHHPVDPSALPVILPPMTDYQPIISDDPKPLLAKATDWLHTTAGEAGVSSLPADAKVTREANTMPGWAGSCWYYLRYCDPKNTDRLVGKEAEKYWMLGGSAPSESASGESASGGSALRADMPSASRTNPSNTLSAYTPKTLLHPAGFIPRDPYPPDTKGPAGDLMVTVRKLPHLTMQGATYFVTWRTADGVTLSASDRDAVLNSLLHFDGSRCRTYAACVMPDHVHWIIRPFEGHELADTVASVKRFAARDVNAASGRSGSVWQTEHLDHIIRDERWFSEFMAYVVNNPVEAGLAATPQAYPHSFVHADASEDSRLGEPTHPDNPTIGGVDLYVGGAEHAVLHLLYARFWHKVLYDLGEVSTQEPFGKLFHQGLILSHAYQRSDKSLVPVDEVENRGTDEAPAYIETATNEPVTQIVAKMSKSLKNVVNPDDVINDYGADTFRLYEMYMGPLEQSKPWNTRDISGMFRFLQRTWRLCIDEQTGAPRLRDTADADIEKRLHRVIDKVGADTERLAFNTAIASMIELVNAATKSAEHQGAGLTADQMDRFARVIGPFAPHLAEELWHRLGHFDTQGSIANAEWPAVDPAMLVDDEVEIVVQIQGKNKAKLMVPASADAKALEGLALADDTIKALIEGKTVRKVIAIPGRLVNIVAT